MELKFSKDISNIKDLKLPAKLTFGVYTRKFQERIKSETSSTTSSELIQAQIKRKKKLQMRFLLPDIKTLKG
ncbi:CLUMA_CG002429, isoform A [Clunio marinus]|uniref:CLUMA_CG002429, isoform A n=1 Tax=Clunio marinus TaxID=568069 RepID=A0A1J1HKP6_9DIPT|nr:CLUMA_CG002429, isoform A [Clunio marinus]